MKTSLQTITWGDPQHHLFDHIFSIAAQSGFDAVEIGFRRLGQVGVGDVKALLDANGLALSACHIGGNLADLAQAATERDGLGKVLDYLTALDCRFLIYSGLNFARDDELEDELAKLREIGRGCAERGVQLLYHNHDWEFRGGRRIWDRLLRAGIDGLGFAPDLGWAVKGGQDMAGLLAEIGDRVHVLHFKDFISWDDGQNTCHLGEGVADFEPAWDWLSRHSDQDIWITAEQDNAEDNDAACRANAAYLAHHLAQVVG